MSNWHYPQWIMLILIALSVVSKITNSIENKDKSTEAMITEWAKKKSEWKEDIYFHVVTLIFQMWLLAKGGFW